jgi:hypothetical protein
MTLDAHIIEASASAQPRAPDPRIARAEMWICILQGLTQIGLWLARALNREAGGEESGQPWPGPRIAFPFVFNPGIAFARVFRAVCLALMLSARIDDEIAEMRAGRFPSDPAPAPLAAPMGNLPEGNAEAARLADKMREIGRETLTQDAETPERAEALLCDLTERLREERMDPAFYRLLNGPIKDAVAAICADLGLRPDWSQWTEDGFPPPPGGEVREWRIFLAPEGETRPARRSHAPEARTPPPGDTGGEGEIVWRPSWRRRRRQNAKPPPDGAARPSSDPGGPP